MIQQTDWDRETGMPRWGCAPLAGWIVAPYHAAGRFPEQPTREEAHAIYWDARARVSRINPPHHVIEVGPASAQWRLTTWSPTELLEITCGYVGDGWHAAQDPDVLFWYPGHPPKPGYLLAAPWDIDGITYTIINTGRPGGGLHARLFGPRGDRLIYDPDESLHVDPWARSHEWRAIKIWRV